ncbi:MAG: DUF4270 domain-containing protein [Saprospiraceae bacterium]|nr:DUF4270 domain-containing protein [Saprospiraceae bacterium]MDW8483434.1 DUF4270 family protein [Saprospiraceae bacterium]
MRQTQILSPISIGLIWASTLLLFQCSKPTDFGAELLESERGEFAYTDTLTLRFSVEREDSTETSDRSSTSPYLLCGQIYDPCFGRSTAAVYTLFRLGSFGPRFQNALIDSAVLFLRYAAEGFYGDTLISQTIRVHRVAAGHTLRWNRVYYSNQALPVDELLGEALNVRPQPRTNVPLFDTTQRGPYLRIPISTAFGQEILNSDSLVLTSDTLFWELIRGIRITATPDADPGAILAFDLNNLDFSFLRLYYKYANDTLTTSRVFDFPFFGVNKFNSFEHDYTGSLAENYVGKPAHDLAFVQGMGGLRVKIEVPYAHLLDRIAVNKAELELTIAHPLGVKATFPPVKQMTLSELVGDTLRSFIPDVTYSLNIFNDFSRFGGTPKIVEANGQLVERYRLVLTQRLQAMVDNASGDLKAQTLYLSAFPQSRTANRVVLYGPKSAVFPAKLTVKYTVVR